MHYQYGTFIKTDRNRFSIRTSPLCMLLLLKELFLIETFCKLKIVLSNNIPRLHKNFTYIGWAVFVKLMFKIHLWCFSYDRNRFSLLFCLIFCASSVVVGITCVPIGHILLQNNRNREVSWFKYYSRMSP